MWRVHDIYGRYKLVPLVVQRQRRYLVFLAIVETFSPGHTSSLGRGPTVLQCQTCEGTAWVLGRPWRKGILQAGRRPISVSVGLMGGHTLPTLIGQVTMAQQATQPANNTLLQAPPVPLKLKLKVNCRRVCLVGIAAPARFVCSPRLCEEANG